MANIKGGRSARKRDRQNAKANKRNVAVKTRLHTAHKKLFKAADAGKKDEAEKEFKDFVSGLDKAVKKGVIKKTPLSAYSRPRANGVNAIIIREDDQLLQVALTDGNSQIIMANRNGRAIRFNEGTVRAMGRMSTGVRGMTLDDPDDEVVGMVTMKENSEETIMVVSENGFGKRSDIEDYRVTNRGAKGVKTLNITDKTGKLAAIMSVTDKNDLVIINQSGITLRLKVADVRVMGRATQGVKLIDLTKRGDSIASVCKVDSDPEEAAAEDNAEESSSVSEGISVTED